MTASLRRSRFLVAAGRSALALAWGETALLLAAPSVAAAFLREPVLRHLEAGGRVRLQCTDPVRWGIDHARLEVSGGCPPGLHDRVTVLGAGDRVEAVVEIASTGRGSGRRSRPALPSAGVVLDLSRPPIIEVRRPGEPTLTVEGTFLSAPAASRRAALATRRAA